VLFFRLIIVIISLTLVGCGGKKGGSAAAVVVACTGSTGQTITLTTSDSSISESSSDNVTLTATASSTSCSDITVTLSTSGTATNGTDYSSLNGQTITVSSGSTTGTKTFTTTDDSTYEGNETVIVAISSVSGSSATESGTQSVTITITEYALRSGTTFTEGSTSVQNAIKAETQWTNVDYDDSTSSVHPYEQMNIHKAQSYSDGTNNLTGIGQFIHIADFNCDDDHLVYSNKTIHNLDDGGSGESTFSAANSSNYHCQFVASMAAGDGTGDGDGSGENLVSGVAPDADLILSSIPNYNGTYRTDDWGADLDSARGYGAVASNQSWAVSDMGSWSTCARGDANCNFNATEFQALLDANPLKSTNQILAFVLEGTISGSSSASNWITALDNFQNSGVIVFASGNSTVENDVSLVGALPKWYSQLAEAWISVGLVDFTGSSIADATESDFTIKGQMCGSAKEYCVVADGWQVNGGGYISSGTHYYQEGAGGSSFTAPMVSGGIALLSQAFPNHSPAQLTDRLLASSNNSWFTPAGNTTFTTHGNSITHGYHATWGHGLPDFYAALSPITSNANPAMVLYTGDSVQSSKGTTLASSFITPSSSFGNAISQGLIGEVGYAYDALSGGFKYDMSTRVNLANNNAPFINLSTELYKLDSQLPVGHNSHWKENFSQVLSTLSKRDGLETTLTLGASSLPVQSFFGSNLDSSANLSDFQTPYLESGEGGIGLSANYQLGNSRLLIGATNPILVNNLTGNVVGSRKSVVASLEYGNPSEAAFTLMTGITQDKDNLLGSTGSDAFSLSGSKSNTTFAALKAQSQFNKDLTLTGIATVAKSDMTRPTESYINSASSVKSSSVSLIANQQNIIGDDSFSFSISQPNRVSNGNMSIRLSNLAEADGSISYRNSNINLEPTGRQMVYGLSYRKDLDEELGFSIKHLLTSNLNHNQDSDLIRSSYIGLKHKDLKLGFNINSFDSSKNTELEYLHIF
jgi:hypothetical protein